MVKPSKAGRSGTRAISYTRQSMFREESISLEMQDKANRTYAAQRGYTVVKTVQDPGVSGLQFAKRPGIREAIELVEAGEADVIIVWRWSRLSRRLPHVNVIMDRVEKAGGRVESATEPIDATTAGGRFSRTMMLAFAEFESDQKSEVWLDVQRRRVSRGLPPGGRAPFGYTRPVDSKGKPIRDAPPQKHPEHAPIVREMYEMYLRGHGPRTIADWLNHEKKVTPIPKKRNGESRPTPRKFTAGTVARILDSGFAAGYLVVHDPECPVPRRMGDNHTRTCERRVHPLNPDREPIRGAHEPIITEETWQAYKRARESRRRQHPKVRQPKWYFGGGLAVCGHCGSNVHVSSYTNPGAQVRCTNNAHRGYGACPGVWVNRRWMEWAVFLWLNTRVEEWVSRAEEMRGTSAERDRLVRALEEARADEAKIQRGLRSLQSLVASGDLSDEDYRARRREAEEKLKVTAERIEDAQARLDALNPDGDVYERLHSLLGAEMPAWTGPGEPPPDWNGEAVFTRGLSTEEWAQLLRKIIRRVRVWTDRIEVEPLRGESKVISRRVPKPEKPDRKPNRRGRRDAARDPRTGRFTLEHRPVMS